MLNQRKKDEKMATQREKHIEDKDISLKAVIIVVSDSLSKRKENWRQFDTSAGKAENILKKKSVNIQDILIIPDEIDQIQSLVHKSLIDNPNLIVLIGGTGVSPRDVTIEAIRPILEKELPGFGELFRLKTFQEVGTISMMTRTIAGVVNESVIVCLPGSKNAVSLGVTLILEELLHIINLRKKMK
jgi:molybdenum cofactor biosynthesis protein B